MEGEREDVHLCTCQNNEFSHCHTSHSFSLGKACLFGNELNKILSNNIDIGRLPPLGQSTFLLYFR